MTSLTSVTAWLGELPIDGVSNVALCLLAFGFFLSFVPAAVPGSWRVIRVVDGDTIVVRRGRTKRKVRLLGIDTPESVHPKRRAEYYGRQASRQLKRLLRGQRVFLRYDSGKPQKDIYGRTLAYVVRVKDGLDVNLRLLCTGHARVYRKAKFRRMDELLAVERDARLDYRGLWRPLWLRPTGWCYDTFRSLILAGVRPLLAVSLILLALSTVAPELMGQFAETGQPYFESTIAHIRHSGDTLLASVPGLKTMLNDASTVLAEVR